MKVIVLGAGATGLTTAYLLARAGVEVTIVEAASTAGGLLDTFDVGNGSRLEYFYHHFFTHDAEVHWLLHELGLSDQIVYRPSSMGVYSGGRLYDFNGPRDILKFRAMNPIARLRFGLSSAMLAYRKSFAEVEHVRCLDWFERWAGAAATKAIWRPMLNIKFGDAAADVPLAWMAGRLRQRVLSRQRGVEKLGYLSGSLKVLVDRLLTVLSDLGVAVQLNSPVTHLLASRGRVVGVQIRDKRLYADRVVSTMPTPVLSKVVAPFDRVYADQLSEIRYLGAMCTVIALSKSLSSIYWTNISDGGYDFGGVIGHTNLVPPEEYGGLHLLYLSRYLSSSHELWTMCDQQLVERQVDQLARIYRADVRRLIQRTWVFRARFAAPVADIGFHRRIPEFATPIPNLYMASMCHVYPDERSVNNSIRVGAELVRALGLAKAADVVPRGASLAAKYGHHPTHFRAKAA